ncbi:MAG: hypothetical protein DRP87_02345 [Spirochaetes bacterium]|nr:MAG: hypothetical protein DRP87_02345 [Spirochaetota bacterium]
MKPKHSFKKSFLFLLWVISCNFLFFQGCTGIKSLSIKDHYVPKEIKEKIKSVPILLQSVSVKKQVNSKEAEYDCRRILMLLLRKRNEKIPSSDENYFLNVVVKEESFMEGYRSLNSVSVEMNLTAGNGHISAASAMLAEQSTETISSFTYLYGILRRALVSFL